MTNFSNSCVTVSFSGGLYSIEVVVLIEICVLLQILEVVNWKTNQNTFMPSLLSHHITLGKGQKGTNIEFCLPVTSLQKVLSRDKEINMCEVRRIVTDDIICEVHEETIKKDVSIVFEINRNVFIKEVLQDIVSDPIKWRKTLARSLLPHSEEKKVIVEYR